MIKVALITITVILKSYWTAFIFQEIAFSHYISNFYISRWCNLTIWKNIFFHLAQGTFKTITISTPSSAITKTVILHLVSHNDYSLRCNERDRPRWRKNGSIWVRFEVILPRNFHSPHLIFTSIDISHIIFIY